MQKLKIYLEQIEDTVVMRVIEQEDISENKNYHIFINDTPELRTNGVFLRGKNKLFDNYTACVVLDSKETAKKYIDEIIDNINNYFNYVNIKPGMTAYFRNDATYYQRIFLHDLGEQVKEGRFVVVNPAFECEYYNKKPYKVQLYNEMNGVNIKTNHDKNEHIFSWLRQYSCNFLQGTCN